MTSAAAPLRAGARAIINYLASRKDLNGVEATLLGFDPSSGRWGVRTVLGECVRVRSTNLTACVGLLEDFPMLYEIFERCEPLALRSVAGTCHASHILAMATLSSAPYSERVERLALLRWRMSRSIYGFISLDTCQRHRGGTSPTRVSPGCVSSIGDRVAHASANGTAHLWDVEHGQMLAAFVAPRFQLNDVDVGTAIEQVALSSAGWLAAAARAWASPTDAGQRTRPHVLLYDARDKCEPSSSGSGRGETGPQPARDRHPLMQQPCPDVPDAADGSRCWDVAALGWVSATNFVTLQLSPRSGTQGSLGSYVTRFEILPDGSGWANDQRHTFESRMHVPDVQAPGVCETLVTHQALGIAACGHTDGEVRIWALGAKQRGAVDDSAADGSARLGPRSQGCECVAQFCSGHVSRPQCRHATAFSALALSSSGQLLSSAGAHDFTIRIHKLSLPESATSTVRPSAAPEAEAATVSLLGVVNYRDVIATRTWFTSWQLSAAATNGIDEEEDPDVAGGDDCFHACYRVLGGTALVEGAKFLLQSMHMSGERMLVTGHRKGCLCVWELPRASALAGAAGSDSGGGAITLLASLSPPDAHAPPTGKPLTPSTAAMDGDGQPITASDEMVRGVAIVGTAGAALAGPAVVYANRAGALTKLCTLDSAELSEATEREWERSWDDGAPGERDGGETASGLTAREAALLESRLHEMGIE